MLKENASLMMRMNPIAKDQPLSKSPRTEEMNEGAIVRFTLKDLIGGTVPMTQQNFGPSGSLTAQLNGLLKSTARSNKPIK